jgi:hypothetical protein
VATVDTGVNCQALAGDAGVTWAACITAHRIDPDRDTLVATRTGAVNGLVVADGAAWALDFDRTLTRTGNSDQTVRTVRAPAGSEGIGVGYGAVWIANPDITGTVTREGRGSLTRIPTDCFGATRPRPDAHADRRVTALTAPHRRSRSGTAPVR